MTVLRGANMENRIVNLEVRYTHLERQVDELSQVVFEQQKVIDRMTRELRALQARLNGVDDDSANEPPPHY